MWMLILNIIEVEHEELDKKNTKTLKAYQEANVIVEIYSYTTFLLLLMETIKE